MADISAKNALSNVTNDIKSRPLMDAFGGDMSGAQFLDVMMARLTALGNTDENLKSIAKEAADKGYAREANILNQMRGLKNKPHVKNAAEARETSSVAKTDIKTKIKERIQEIQSRDVIDISEDKSLKALQKVAKFLLGAEQDGAIDLPPELTQKLQEFIDKGTDLKASDIASFMREFSDAFKTMIVSMVALPKDGETLQWPKELSAELKELGLSALINDDAALTTYDIARLVKALANQGEKVAVAAINDKARETILPQDRADILVNAAAAHGKDQLGNVAAPQPITQPTAQTVAPEAAVTAPKPVKDFNDRNASENAETASDTLSRLFGDSGESQNAKTKKSADRRSGDGADPFATQNYGSKGRDAASPHATLVQAVAAGAARASSAATPSFAKEPAVSGITNSLHSASALHAAADQVNKTSHQTQAGRFAAALQQAETSPATQQVSVQLQQRAGKAGTISLQLSPAELGRVDVRISIGRDGVAHAIVAADKPETLAMLQRDASALERALQQAGLNANQENMSFNLREQRQSQQFDQNRKRFSRGGLEDGINDVALNAAIPEAIFSDDRINYHA